MNREPITLRNLLMRARLQDQKVYVRIIERVYWIYIRELKIHDAGGSTTRSEFQLKNEC
jgi:hypothetical protein